MTKQSPFPSIYLLTIGLAIVFYASAIEAILDPGDVRNTLVNSLFSHVLTPSPFLILLIGIHNFILAILLACRFKPKIVTAWAIIWIIITMLFIFSSISLPSMFNAYQQIGFLTTAVYLNRAANAREGQEKT